MLSAIACLRITTGHWLTTLPLLHIFNISVPFRPVWIIHETNNYAPIKVFYFIYYYSVKQNGVIQVLLCYLRSTFAYTPRFITNGKPQVYYPTQNIEYYYENSTVLLYQIQEDKTSTTMLNSHNDYKLNRKYNRYNTYVFGKAICICSLVFA